MNEILRYHTNDYWNIQITLMVTLCHLNTSAQVIRKLGGAAGKCLARPTSRCRRTESVVPLERRVCSCAELQVFSCYRG